MSATTERFQVQKSTARRKPVRLCVLTVLALALLSISGCVALTGSPTAKSSSTSASSGTLTASSANLNFGTVVAGSSSLQTLTLTNAGAAAVTVSQATVTGSGFSLVGTMSSISIAAGQTHAFQVRFSPTASGSDSGDVTIASDASNASLGIPLSGTATAGLAISSQPASETVTAGQTATFSVVAAGSGTLKYQWQKGGTAITGATAATYSTPPTTVSETGAVFTVTVTDGGDDNVTSSAATLTVDALPPTLNASNSSLNFSNVNVGSSVALPVVLTNAGTSPITISNVMIAGAGYTVGGVQSGQILTAGQTATLDVTFDPSATGTLPGSATVTSNAANSPAKIALTGVGVQAVQHSASLSWVASASTVSGYNAYRSTVSGGPYAKLDATPIAATSLTDAAVQAGQTYYYVVTSVESSGLESVYSSEVSATIP
ncbi:MAG TPA: choice-of-anchor D domain-containing protein [Candidatus Sulfotelmatobacter sp.]|jgi:hypothetical protein|nr:choice-of-anchor D domain-containing protein [Candidatus Sulfotelmatobacter sp.]